MNDIRQQRVRGDGLDLQVRIMGDGPPVILLHGFPENARSWRHQMPALTAAGYSAWAPNLRGYPPSGIPATRDGCSLPRLVRDVAAVIHATGHAKVRLVGHDWGVIIAWAFAAAHPEQLEQLVIINAPHMQVFRERIWRGGQFLRSSYAGVFQLPWLPEQALSARGYRLLRAMYRMGGRRRAFRREDIDDYVHTLAQPGALRAALDYYRVNMRPGGMDLARRRVESETLVIWGERDPALGTVLLDGLQRYVPDLRVHRIPEVGHWVQNEAPDEVNRLLLGFFGAAGASGRQ